MESPTEKSLMTRQREEAVARMKLLCLPVQVIDAFSRGQYCRLSLNGDDYEIIEDEETVAKIAEFEREHQATVFLVATIFVEWLSHDREVLAFVGNNEGQWDADRESIEKGYTWVRALSDNIEDAGYLEGHVDLDVLLPLRVWQKKTAISWLNKMKVDEYIIEDFEKSGQVYVYVMNDIDEYGDDNDGFRKPDAILKRQIAAFEKRRNALVYMAIRDKRFDEKYLAYVTGDRGGDGDFREQRNAVDHDSLNVYELCPGRGYVNQYCENNLKFIRGSGDRFVCFVDEGW